MAKFFDSKAFSLTEVLVVVGIIASLSAISLPMYNKYKCKAKRAQAHSALTTVINSQKTAYSSIGTYAMWSGVGVPAGEKKIAGELIFGLCGAPPCGDYNYLLSTGGAASIDYAQRRAAADVNGITPTIAADMSTDYDDFVIAAKGSIFDGGGGVGSRYGDVLYYSSDLNTMEQRCDDLKQTGGATCLY